MTLQVKDRDKVMEPYGLGEAEGLKISLAGAEDKLAQIDRRTRTTAPVGLGMSALSHTPATN